MKHDKLTVFLLVFSVVYLLMMPFAALREDMGIYDGVIRLHVLADSDEPEAQRLKLKVRDGILGIMDDMLDGTEDIESRKRKDPPRSGEDTPREWLGTPGRRHADI